MHIALVTDAWSPQINGVVRTLQTTMAELEALGHRVSVLEPSQFRTLPCPTYPDIRLALAWAGSLGRRLDALSPDAIHIATEGPLGFAARRACVQRGWPFTTAFHTRFPDYIQLRAGVPARLTWPLFRWFHRASAAVMVATPSLAAELAGQGLRHTRLWGRGVDTQRFQPGLRAPDALLSLPRPLLLYVGRVTTEKNLEAFLRCAHPGSKVVVGDGPELDGWRTRYPSALFTGALTGAPLAGAFAAADAFVFPSHTDTYGIVLLEALASGTPVAGFPVPGPLDVIGCDGLGGPHRVSRPVGCLDADLDKAIAGALRCRRDDARAYAERFSWSACTQQFLTNLHPALPEHVWARAA
jgi:glycosyltransferase involved in cell wall biosynthesis